MQRKALFLQPTLKNKQRKNEQQERSRQESETGSETKIASRSLLDTP